MEKVVFAPDILVLFIQFEGDSRLGLRQTYGNKDKQVTSYSNLQLYIVSTKAKKCSNIYAFIKCCVSLVYTISTRKQIHALRIFLLQLKVAVVR